MIGQNLPPTAFPRPDVIMFIFQIVLILIVICVSLYNLTMELGDERFWTGLATLVLGVGLPNPTFRNFTREMEVYKRDPKPEGT
jgi:uncharacterized membrane protein